MESKDKIMLNCIREVKYKQGFTEGTWYYVYNSLGVTLSTCSSGIMVSTSKFKNGNP